MTDKLSQARELLYQSNELAIKAYALLSEFYEAYGALTIPPAADVSNAGNSSIPPPAGGDFTSRSDAWHALAKKGSMPANRDGQCAVCTGAIVVGQPIRSFVYPGDGWKSWGHAACVQAREEAKR